MSTFAKRLVAGLVVLLVVAGVAGWRLIGRDSGVDFEARFSSTVGLYPGSDVQVLGVPVGKVTAVIPDGDTVRVKMRLDPGQKVSSETGAVIVAPTLVSDRFVQLTKPLTSGHALADRQVIPAAKTAVPVEVDQLYRSLIDVSEQLGPNGANKNGALSRLLDVASKNLGGNGKDINTMIREFGKASATLSGTGDDFFATVGNLQELNKMLVANDSQVASVNRRFSTVAEYLAADRQDMAQAVANLGDALGVVDDFIKENRGHLRSSVKNLVGPTQVLVKQKESLQQSVQLIPIALQNFLNAYNARTNTVDGRGNLNELSMGSAAGSGSRTTSNLPPTLLPGMGGTQ